jgi:hypothetical protein
VTRTSKIISGGFLVRAFLGQALFWISWLQLPIGRSLQLGNGFWFFAVDGKDYLQLAEAISEASLPAILFGNFRIPSHLFIRLLALLVAALGAVASLAILINCAAYVLMCVLLARMGKDDVLFAAMAFGPAAILFSTQLLKDTVFFLLIVLMIVLFRRWQELWRGGSAPNPILACAAGMVAIVYALAGIRWYFAAIVWGASAVFFALVTWTAPRRRWAFAASLLLLALLGVSVRLGGTDMPGIIARVFTPKTTSEWKPAAATTIVASARQGFERTPGGTTIEKGPVLASPSSPDATQTPQTFAARVMTGLTATFVPRFIAQPLGLVRIGGGRGFWWFADVDTILFDLVLLYATFRCIRALRRSTARATPLFVLLVLVFVCTAGPLIYTVNNFGTLFRLRQMLYVVAIAAPLTLRSAVSDQTV